MVGMTESMGRCLDWMVEIAYTQPFDLHSSPSARGGGGRGGIHSCKEEIAHILML